MKYIYNRMPKSTIFATEIISMNSYCPCGVIDTLSSSITTHTIPNNLLKKETKASQYYEYRSANLWGV